MDYMPEGVHESLIVTPQEKTARRTRHLLVAARLCFLFSHGLLAISTSVALGCEADISWWAVFIPVWLGDTLSGAFCVLSWFASCPYIQLCLAERQARLGETNPSILTDILPDIVWAILGVLFVFFALIGELFLCRYLTLGQQGEEHDLWPSATVFILTSVLACTRGILVSTSSELYVCCGAAVLFTTAFALWGPSQWVLVLPSVISVSCLLGASARRLRECSAVLIREESLLHIAEQAVLLVVSLVLAGLTAVLAARQREAEGSHHRAHGLVVLAAILGAVAGVGVCIVAAFRARMALVESRYGAVADRLLSLHACHPTYPERVPAVQHHNPQPTREASAPGPPTPF